ncbi:Myophilin, partial [Trichinella patagoniensis]
LIYLSGYAFYCFYALLPGIYNSLTFSASQFRSTMSRADKSGIAAEAHAKIQSKYNCQLAEQILKWISDVSNQQDLNTDGSMENFINVLKDGTVLCRLANALQPGAIKKINDSKMAFKQMENINHFLNFAETVVGIPKTESFMTVDLYEAQDPNSVLICLSSVARKAEKFNKPSLGPKEAQGEKREWTEEQIRAGECVIGLQYGSNKGATQAGMNIGKSRHIILNE